MQNCCSNKVRTNFDSEFLVEHSNDTFERTPYDSPSIASEIYEMGNSGYPLLATSIADVMPNIKLLNIDRIFEFDLVRTVRTKPRVVRIFWISYRLLPHRLPPDRVTPSCGQSTLLEDSSCCYYADAVILSSILELKLLK